MSGQMFQTLKVFEDMAEALLPEIDEKARLATHADGVNPFLGLRLQPKKSSPFIIN